MDCHDHDCTSQPITKRTGVNAAKVVKLILENWQVPSEVADSALMRT
jgi:hypothetical protein